MARELIKYRKIDDIIDSILHFLRYGERGHPSYREVIEDYNRKLDSTDGKLAVGVKPEEPSEVYSELQWKFGDGLFMWGDAVDVLNERLGFSKRRAVNEISKLLWNHGVLVSVGGKKVKMEQLLYPIPASRTLRDSIIRRSELKAREPLKQKSKRKYASDMKTSQSVTIGRR